MKNTYDKKNRAENFTTLSQYTPMLGSFLLPIQKNARLIQ